MPYLKKLGLAAVAVMAMSVAACTGATATVLYRSEEEDTLNTNGQASPSLGRTDSSCPAARSVTGEVDNTHVTHVTHNIDRQRGCERTITRTLACNQSKVSHEVGRRDISLI